MTEKNKGGRPTIYSDKLDEQVYKLKRQGMSDVEVADFFGFCTSTLDNWKNQYPTFLGCYKKGLADKEAHDIVKVKNALLRRAKGLSLKETREEVADDGRTKTITVTKEVAPDTTACAIWLNNKAPDEFKPRKAAEEDKEQDDSLANALSKLADKLPD